MRILAIPASPLFFISLRSFGARHPCLFSLASRRASVFLLRGQREDTKRKATPIQRSPGSCPATAQRDSGGSPTVHPWTGVELAAIHCAHPAGFPSITLPLHRGPIHCASCAAKTKQIPACFGFAIPFLLPQGGRRCPAGRMRALLTLI